MDSMPSEFKHDVKRTCSIINESLHRKKKTISSRIFYHNGKPLEDPSEIANAFNEYFISISPFLANTIDKNNNFRKYLRNASESRLYFEPKRRLYFHYNENYRKSEKQNKHRKLMVSQIYC